MALAAKRGKKGMPGKAREMAEDMDEGTLRDFAATKREGLPETAKAACAMELARIACLL
jgi:hypothetical protein